MLSNQSEEGAVPVNAVRRWSNLEPEPVVHNDRCKIHHIISWEVPKKQALEGFIIVQGCEPSC
jgi:hypothetical protein